MSKYIRAIIILSILFSIVSLSAQRRTKPKKGDATENSSVAQLADSVAIDSLVIDSLQADSLAPKKGEKSSVFTAPVRYKATDSVTFTGDNNAAMYGNSQLSYTNMELQADRITMNLDNSDVFAFGGEKIDSATGKPVGTPIFKDNGGEYKSESMKYNFQSQKGYITNVVTQQGEGYVTGGQTKKLPNNDLYMMNGKYSTCDNHDHPHFYFGLTRAKVTPGKNIVTGPAYLVLEDVILPIAVPFGFFPFNSSYSSGIIFPAFGEENNRGFFLRNGGYYFAINDNVDLALTGEIYTKGSWGINARSSYNRRYKYTGSFNLGYLTTVTGDKGMADYSKGTDFKLSWTHSQDSKANPNSTFSASVNLSTSSYDRKQMDSYYNPNVFTQNTKSSSVSYSYRFPTVPLTISSNFSVNQRTQDSAIAVTLPDMNITLSRIYPFKRKVMIGTERWYEKIALNYTGQLRNSIDTKEDKIIQSNIIKDWRNGMQHNIPISATFSLFKNLSITPSFNYTERWYKEKVMRDWDPLASKEVLDTISGFNRVYNYSFNVGVSTKLYGFYKPWKIFGDKIQMIRHVVTPSVTLTAAPDFGAPSYGFWTSYSKTDNLNNEIITKYSPYQNAIFGTAPTGKQSILNFSVQNNLEMKLKDKEEEEEESSNGSSKNKISLIDNFTGGISYNGAADSMNWSNISTQLRLKFTEKFSLNLNGTFDTYMYELNQAGSPVRVNKMRIANGKGLGRLSSTSTSFSYTLNNDTFKKKEKSNKKNSNDPELDEEEEFNELDSMMQNPNAILDPEFNKKRMSKKKTEGGIDADGYDKLAITWNLGFNYSLTYAYADFNKEKMEYNTKLSHNLGITGNLDITKNWKFSLSTSWDFEQKKLAMMTCNLSRNLHCWTLTASFVPIGPYQSYFFTIAVNSSLLKDVKWDKRSSPYDAREW